MVSLFQPSSVCFEDALKRPDDPRFANLIRRYDEKKKLGNIALLGAPFELGVKNSGGRVGTAKAPDAIRGQLFKYGTTVNLARVSNMGELLITDFGNVFADDTDICFSHSETRKAVRFALSCSSTVIVFGGGHDLSYATVSALSEEYKEIGGMNIDAHFDVRPIIGGNITSGTPFWRLLAERTIPRERFFEVGAQGHVNAKAHLDFLRERKAHVTFLPEFRRMGAGFVMSEFEKTLRNCDALFVSVDMDSVASAFAPGVSAPSPDGLFPEDVLEIAYCAGLNRKVRLFEIMEMNPLYDIDSRTARLSANIVLEFCAGFAKRWGT